MITAIKLRIGFTAPICFAIASSTARFCCGKTAGDSHTRRRSSLSRTASTIACSWRRAISASILFLENHFDQGAGVTAGNCGHSLLAVLSEMIGKLADQRVVSRVIDAQLAAPPGRRPARPRSLSARGARCAQSRRSPFRPPHNLLLVFFRSLADARLLGDSLTFCRSANLLHFSVQLAQARFDIGQAARGVCAGGLRFANTLLNAQRCVRGKPAAPST